jgi:hypothetical protein
MIVRHARALTLTYPLNVAVQSLTYAMRVS